MGATAVLTLIVLGDAVLRAGWSEMLLLAPWMLLVLWGVYVMLFVSHIEIDGAAVTVQNFLRRTVVPWARVTDIRVRWQLTLVIDDGTTIAAYGGAVAGRPGRATRRTSDKPGSSEPPALRELTLIREQWETAVEQGAASGPIVRSWDWLSLGVFAGLILWAIGAVISVGGFSL